MSIYEDEPDFDDAALDEELEPDELLLSAAEGDDDAFAADDDE